MLVPDNLHLELSKVEFMNDQRLLDGQESESPAVLRRLRRHADSLQLYITHTQPHNTIHRLTGTTGEGQFAPYTQKIMHCFPNLKLAILALIENDKTDIHRVCSALENIGRWGFGRDASIGQGQFKILSNKKISLPNPGPGTNAAYSLAPVVPQKDSFKQAFFRPFIRFGKHGDQLARSGQPFKNPVIMADEGAVFIPRDQAFFAKPYMGMAVTGLSKTEPATVMQGYAPYVPFKLEI